MKRIAAAFFALLIVLAPAGCAKASPTQDSELAADVTTPSEPAPRVFDADSVDMEPTPDSTCFEAVGYDSAFEVLVVRFRDSGSRYTYLDFPESEWSDFMAADSLGSFYNAHIKGEYECTKID